MRKNLTSVIDTNFDKKSGYIDERIEDDIQYFALNFSQKQKQITLLKKAIRKNERKIEGRKVQKAMASQIIHKKTGILGNLS